MAFKQDGTWIPDYTGPTQQVNNNVGLEPQPMMQLGGFRQPAPQQNSIQFNPQLPMVGNQIMTKAGHINGGPNQNSSFGPINQNMRPGAISNTTQPAANYQGFTDNLFDGSNPNPPAPPQTPTQLNPMPQQMPYQAPQYGPSMSQMVNRRSPQDVQNYLHALHNAPGGMTAQTNAWRNPVGMQGQGPQAGFQGFQQNGQINQGPNPAQFYNPNASTQMSYAKNWATGGQVSPGAGVTSGTKGIQNQPQYQTPQYGNGTTPDLPATNTQPKPSGKQQIQTESGESGPKGDGNYPQKGENAYSDERVKENIKGGEKGIENFLDSLGVHSYEYKDPKYGDGRRISPMAQEIEKTPLGKAAISTNEEGYKMVDYGKLGGTMLASLALLNHKYDKLEEDFKKSIMDNLKKKKEK